jgi:uncharacterized protein (TIGR02145 family)
MIRKYTAGLIVFLLSAALYSQTSDPPQKLKKSALVIGNGNYSSGILANPENDAKAVSSTLKNLGFVFQNYENLDQNHMKKAIDDFGLNLKGYDVGLFFYAGHGIQTNGYNYLVPIDAQLTTERQVEYDCVQADRILALMEGSGTRVNIIILDACRNNPFERSWTRSSAGKGLAFMNAPVGTLIAYSTAPGTTARDGSGNNSPYTSAFLESLRIPGLSINQMFQNVTRLVSDKTDKQQIPWISSSLTGDFYLNAAGPATTENVDDDIFLDPVENVRYKTVRIGNQVWMAENLRNTKFYDGTSIPLVTDISEWENLTTPGYCWYLDEWAPYDISYGALYNWYAVNTGKLCPIGWHVPTDDEWKQLEIYLGMSRAMADQTGWRGTNQGGKLKESDTIHWQSPNTGATNETGFTALPGGFRYYLPAGFGNLGKTGYWWCSSKDSIDWMRMLIYYDNRVARIKNPALGSALSVRCVMD